MNDFEFVLDELVADAPVERASWDDVVARARRPRRRRIAAAAAALAVVAVVVATPAFGVGTRLLDLFASGTPVPTSRLSDNDLRVLSAMVSGTPIADVPASKEAELAQIGGTSIREIAERDGRAYFVIDKSDGTHCFAAGDVGQADLFGAIECGRTPAFPSPELPILDFSVFRGHMSQDLPYIWRLEGFAADGVAKVGVVTADGSVAATAPVEQNVYVLTADALPSEPVKEIVAFAADGTRLYAECLARGPDARC